MVKKIVPCRCIDNLPIRLNSASKERNKIVSKPVFQTVFAKLIRKMIEEATSSALKLIRSSQLGHNQLISP